MKRITEIISDATPSLSFEVFPPKKWDNYESVLKNAMEIAQLSPSFMSVTYGAGGGTSDYTADICSKISALGVPSIAHLSCISSTKEHVRGMLDKLSSLGIKNILALRGDIPEGLDTSSLEYRYASDLAREIKEYGGFTVGGACYPEGHPEADSFDSDIEALKIKVDSGCEFLTTQMFFDNNILYNFMYRLLRRGVDVPVIAGIMPVTDARQIKRIMSISGGSLPQRFIRLVDRYSDKPEAMMQAGIAYATEQIIDLYANGVNAVHVYSMNKPAVARKIQENLSEIIK